MSFEAPSHSRRPSTFPNVRRPGIRAARFPRLVLGLALLAAFALAGCGEQRKPVIPHAVWTTLHDHREAVEGRDSTTVRISWPDFIGARTPEALDSLRATVNALLLAPAVSESLPASNPSALMDGFIRNWNAIRQATGSREYWMLERNVTVLGDTLGVVALELVEHAYTGGAHANSTTRLVNVDADAGSRLRFADVFNEELRDSLDRAIEPLFRMTRGVAPDSSLKAAGFWFEDERFHLNDNFAFTPGGMLWHFDPYEIAPYAMGPTDFVVPYGVLRAFGKEGGKLAGR